MYSENDHKNLKNLALIFGIVYIIVSIVGIICLFTNAVNLILIDPIEQVIQILIGVIFLRGYINFNKKNYSGEAFLFVGTIIGIVLGILSFLDLLFGGLFGGLITESSLNNFIKRIVSYSLKPALILGFLTFIPHKIIKQREMIQ